MINDAVGVRTGSVIDVDYGRPGHALYGPYLNAAPGDYVAVFELEPLEPEGPPTICALVDVACDAGRAVLARAAVFTTQIRDNPLFELPFSLDRGVADLELRVYVNGTARVRVTDSCTFQPAAGRRARAPAPPPPSKFLAQSPRDVENVYANGFKISAVGEDLIVQHSGVSLHAREFDDVRFLGEIFMSRVYCLKPPSPSVLIDVGMNIGLTSLLLAQQANFEEVYAFEPFARTYERAVENLRLNPAVANKIQPFNVGLSDRDETLTGYFNSLDSGQSSVTVAGGGDQAVRAKVRDAATVLEPIFARAQSQGRRIIMKIDCEGSEYALFRSMIGRGLLDRVTAMMVEWHRGFGAKEDLLRPLEERKFIVIDHDTGSGNGFFYAVREA